MRKKNGAGVFQISLLFALTLTIPRFAEAGALENYVQKTDNSFAWRKLEEHLTNGFTITHLELTSQTWREIPWKHDLQIVRPPKMRNPQGALLFITGDGDGRRDLERLTLLAERAGAMAAVVTRVPNQPLFDGRKEDALIAYTFEQFRKSGDETWPLLFPMVKSATRAMDALAAFAKEEYRESPSRFVVSGASKRGWTTWLTAAVDRRVQGIAPMVIDMLNMRPQMAHAQKVYGKQSEEIRDYTDLGLVAKIDTPEIARLRNWVDPYAYRERYTMPKLILIGSNDPYWTVDSLRHYWRDLPEPKLVFQTPNAGHDLGGGKDATQTLATFFQMLADGQKLPTVSWQIDHGPMPSLTISADQPIREASVWVADSLDRDFRDDHWAAQPAKVEAEKTVRANLKAPESGYRAFFGEILLTAPDGHPYKLSTEARVSPDGAE